MIDELLDFYNRELKFVKEEGRAFAQLYPKMAARLRLTKGDSIEDPHVGRLIESFALLCARLRLKIEDEFPDVCQSMLQALYPQYLAPIPSVAICRFECTDKASENADGIRIQRGDTLETEEVKGQPCIFRTCFDTRVFPIKLASAEYLRPPFDFPCERSWEKKAVAALRFKVASTSEKLPISKMKLTKLRLYLGSAESCGNDLYEALVRDTVGLGLFSSALPSGRFLPASVIQTVGFADDEAYLAHDARTSPAYRFLWEFFVSPDKFRFVEFDLGAAVTQVATHELDVVCYLNKVNPRIQRELTDQTIQLGCTPIINLFHHTAKSIHFTGNQVEYKVEPRNNPASTEVYSIDAVTALGTNGERIKYQSFHEPKHDAGTEESAGVYWHASRRRQLRENMAGDRGTEVFVSVVDLCARPQPKEEWILSVETTCCNRDLISELPSGAGEPIVALNESSGLITSALVSSLSPTRRPIVRDEYLWRLISHLSLNHLTLTDSKNEANSPKNGADSLREILRLYNFTEAAEHSKTIDAIKSIRYSRGVARVSCEDLGVGTSTASGRGQERFCRGLEIELTVNEEELVGTGVCLFSSVLERFFSCFATINSYTRLEVKSVSQGQVLFSGKPRAGGQLLQ